MKNFLVVKKLSLFNILIVMLYKFFKFEVYVFESSGRILNWRLVKLLSLKKCNFEDCLDIDLSRYGGNIGKPIDQITSKVRWRESVNYMIKKGVKDFLEIGPGKVLSGLVKKINKNVKISNINSIEDIKNDKF